MSESAEEARIVPEMPALSLPEFFPDWAKDLSHAYMSGSTCLFVLHGNVFDLVRSQDGPGSRYVSLTDFLGTQVFGRWDLVLTYDLSRGLRPHAGADSQRLHGMVDIMSERLAEPKALPREPTRVLRLLDVCFDKLLVESAKPARALSIALVIDFAQYVVPAGHGGYVSQDLSTNLVTLLNWAQNAYLKRINVAFVLLTEKLSDIAPRLAQNPHVQSIELPLPDEPSRGEFVESLASGPELSSCSDFSAQQIARLSAGLTLRNLETLIRQALRSGRRIDAKRFKRFKKQMIERECQGFLEFQEPTHTLDMVVGHEEAKRRLQADARLLQQGDLNAVPMGYLISGPVGTGKTFLTECYAGTVGLPVVKLLNFRSKYVGETEGNLEKILRVLRAMGPVAVIIDEADAAIGDRGQSGDSGTSSRVFSMIAAQMGDTRYRGRIIWFLLTCRPDLLPIDIKRQGRAEVHIPLFYPGNQEEVSKMFLIQARKVGATLETDSVPEVPKGIHLSGADIEGIVTRAWRECLLDGQGQLTKEALQEAVISFIPSADDIEKELQEIAAILECTDSSFLPADLRKKATDPDYRTKLKDRRHEIRTMLET